MTDAKKFEQKPNKPLFIFRIATQYMDEYTSDFFNEGIEAEDLQHALKIIEHKYGPYTEIAYIEDDNGHVYEEIIGGQRFTMSLLTFKKRLQLGIIK